MYALRQLAEVEQLHKFDGAWELIYSEDAKNREEALKREKQLKSYRGRQFIKRFIPV